MDDGLMQLKALALACVDRPAWALPESDLVDALDAIHAVEQAVAAVKLHLVRQVDGRDLATTRHATSTAAWLREHLRISVHAAKRLVDLAREVDRRPALDAALGAGTVHVEQAQVIAKVLAALPADVGPEVVAKAEAELIGYAGQFDPEPLRRLGDRILTHVAPEIAEEAEAKALARREQLAHEGRGLTLTRNGDGRTRIAGWLDAEGAAIANAALDPLCAPRPGSGPERDRRTMAERRVDAFTEVCGLILNTGELPVNGGDRPQIVVTVAFDVLQRELGVGMLDTGETISPARVRRLACDAFVIPAVLGGDGEVLDLGRGRRLFTGAVRRALVLRDGGCAWPGCDRPSRWCEGHHMLAWLDGGPTNVDNGALLCGHHHREIHRGEWIVRLGHDRRPEFIPPAHVDPDRRPRRNIHHTHTIHNRQ